MSISAYPVHVDARLDPGLSRGLWVVKWLLAVPHYVVLAFLWLAFAVLSVVAFFAIAFTGRYPRSIFEFNVGVLRWTWRVAYYSYGALGTDRYPPFSLEERPDYPAHLEVDYPERLSRGLVLVKWWLLAIPHYLVIGLFLGGVGWAFAEDNDSATYGAGLIGLLVLVAAVVLLFTGRYPQSVFDLVLGLNRWVIRVAAYAALMTDAYPPFRLDQGGDDPARFHASPPPVVSPPAGAGTTPPASTSASPPASPSASTPTTGVSGGATESSRWTVGRVVGLVALSVVLLVSLGLTAAGAALAVVDHGLRDDDGFVMSGSTELDTSTYAIVSTSVTIHADTPADLMPRSLLGDVKVSADGDRGSLFVGIAPTSDVRAWLGDTKHATISDYNDHPVYDTSGTAAPQVPPTATDIWVAEAVGAGHQEMVWPVSNGDWTVVVMNADASRGVNAEVSAGATLPAVDWLAPLLLVVGAVGIVGAGVGLILVVRGASRR